MGRAARLGGAAGFAQAVTCGVARVTGLGSCQSTAPSGTGSRPPRGHIERFFTVGSVIKKRRKRMAKKKHRKLLKKTRIQRRRAGK
ncbi:hypothetical protein GCM10022204_42570 [Microlunatus aurantiacus]|uniref:Ribosomal protein mS38 C-terminal domain-containing protein n=1 Tax=Microlunatus aurantiacus TaxID=446786 RepID=A0ABP7EGN6_9ACTN